MNAQGSSEGTRRGLAGRVLGDRYRIERLVSAGASVLIADATDTELGRPVTIKLVRPEIAESAEFRRKFEATMRAMAKLSHPNIAAVFCGNDAMAMGAYQALVAAGKADRVKVFGFDGAEDVVKSINDGKILATGMQFPEVMAQTAATFADEYFKGKRDFPGKMPVAVELVRKDNVENYAAYGEKE